MSAVGAGAVLLGALADGAVKGTVPLLIAALVARRLPTASARHVVWAAGLASLPILAGMAWTRGPDVALELAWGAPLWGLGAAVALAPLVVGLVRLARLTASTPLRRRHGVRIGRSDHVPGPLTWGALRPVVLLPLSAEGWTADQRRAALAHELAHVHRQDWLVHVAVWAVCAVFWFHPAAWWARRELLCEAEQAADDAVVRTGARPTDYASLLVQLARTRAVAGSLAAGPSSLSRRVHAVLGDRDRRPARRVPAALVLLVLGLCTPALAGVSLWSRPADAPLTCVPAPGPLLP
ncbi:MAG: beta-lactamase regulating signal transducer with metallopeptidase domain [Myxococcota bacterium]|jgi:beta-lactamase regulating signal transducer with metallopeptidase domain